MDVKKGVFLPPEAENFWAWVKGAEGAIFFRVEWVWVLFAVEDNFFRGVWVKSPWADIAEMANFVKKGVFLQS